MAAETDLDTAHAAMLAATQSGDDAGGEAAARRFHARLAEAELILLLEEEPAGDNLKPRVFSLEEGPVVLAFDTEERLAEFAGAIVPYAALPGRVLVAMLAGQGLGLGLNLGVAPSSHLLEHEAMVWLAEGLAAEVAAAQGRPQGFLPPDRLPSALISELERRLRGRAAAAALAAADWDDGSTGLLLVLVGVPEAAEAALAQSCAEAAALLGEGAALDVAFRAADDPFLACIAAHVRPLDLTPLPEPEAQAPKGPGLDPDRPPILKW